MRKSHFLSVIVSLAAGSLIGGDAVQVKANTPQILHAGPIELKFQDGELRYLRAGGKEIVRRLYFAVRNKVWATPVPEFSRMELENSGDSFRIQLAARCKSADVDYEWNGVITGTKEGKITFEAEGAPNIDMGSNRIGLCTLFGTESLIGQEFETQNEKGEVTKAVFPEFVSPDLVAKKFQSLSYTTPAGMKVACKLEGATYDMEDQRNWGDTSFKAYAPLKYAYPNAKKGQRERESITLEVAGAPEAKTVAGGPVEISVGGKVVEGARVPAFVKPDPAQKSIGFVDANMHRTKFTDATDLTFYYTSLNHLPDDDTLLENVRAVWHQARTARTFSPHATLRFSPIRVQPGAKDPADARNGKAIVAAWTAALIKYFSLGEVKEIGFAVGPGPADGVLKNISASAGKSLFETDVKPADSGIEAFAIDDEAGRALWVVNTRPEKCEINVATGANTPLKVLRIVEDAAETNDASVKDDHVALRMAPYEVCRIVLGKQPVR